MFFTQVSPVRLFSRVKKSEELNEAKPELWSSKSSDVSTLDDSVQETKKKSMSLKANSFDKSPHEKINNKYIDSFYKIFKTDYSPIPRKMSIIRINSPFDNTDLGQNLWREQFTQEKLDGLFLTNKEIKRQEIINELIVSEMDYVADLSLIIKLYIEPLKMMNLIDMESIDKLFLNIPDLLLLHQVYLQAIHNRKENQFPIINEISDIMLKWIPNLQFYNGYLVPQNKALREYNILIACNFSFREFLDKTTSNPESRGLDLMSYLIKPFQRLLKYPILLKKLIETTPEDSSDYKNTLKCLESIEKEINQIQEAKFDEDNITIFTAWKAHFPNTPKLKLSNDQRSVILQGLLVSVQVDVPLVSITLTNSHRVSIKTNRSSYGTLKSNSYSSPNLKKSIQSQSNTLRHRGPEIYYENIFITLFDDVLVYLPESQRKGISKFQLLSSPHATLCKVTAVRDLPDCPLKGHKNWFMVDTIDVQPTKLVIEAEDQAQKQKWIKALTESIESHTNLVFPN